MEKICVLGSGAWGTAISCVLAENGHEVRIYGIDSGEISDINNNRTNSKYFGFNLRIPSNVRATEDFTNAAENADLFVVAVPSFAVEQTTLKILPYVTEKTIIVNIAKGFDYKTKKTVGEVIRSLLPENCRGNVVSLLGPTFATEVAEKQFTSITASSFFEAASKKVQKIFSNDYFKVFVCSDPIGAEYCSALKNVVALSCGIADGLGYKVNTKASLITHGLEEISRFVRLLGGDEKTCYGLVGTGDLYLTCSSVTSRNYSAGIQIGKTSYEEFKLKNIKTVEGIFACEIAHDLAKEKAINAPIVDFIYEIVYDKKSVKKSFKKLYENLAKA